LLLIYIVLVFQSVQYWLFFLSYIIIVVNLYGIAHGIYIYIYNSVGFCVYSIYQYLFIFLLLVFVFIGVFHLYSAGYFFSYITIVVNLYDIAYGKKIKELFLVFVFTTYTNIYIYIYIFAFGFCVYWCF
jgi:hypothetical protein